MLRWLLFWTSEKPRVFSTLPQQLRTAGLEHRGGADEKRILLRLNDRNRYFAKFGQRQNVCIRLCQLGHLSCIAGGDSIPN